MTYPDVGLTGIHVVRSGYWYSVCGLYPWLLSGFFLGSHHQISKDIADDEKRWQWEKDNIEIMKELLSAKAKQCQEFLNCLMENKDNLLAEATPSKFWGTGMSLFVTKNCSPRYWLGKNMLGALLSELTQALLNEGMQIDAEMNEDVEEDDDENEEEEGDGGDDVWIDASVSASVSVQVGENAQVDNNESADGDDMNVEGENPSDDQDARSRETNPADLTTPKTGKPKTGNSATSAISGRKVIRSRKPSNNNSNKSSDKPSNKSSNKPSSKPHTTKKTTNTTKNKANLNTEQLLTPQQDIRTAMQEAAAKRKEMDSSPDGVIVSESKVQKQLDDVG